MKNCTTCENAVFDELWGRHKCTRYAHYIHEVENYEGCDGYEHDPSKKPPKIKRWIK